MKEGWEVRLLGELCTIKPHKREARESLNPDDLVSFAPMSDLREIERDFSASQERPLSKVVGGYTYFADGDVLVAKITPCFENGKMGIANGLTNGIGFGSSEYVVLRSNGEIDPEYLFYFLSRDEFRAAGQRVMSGAVGHKRVPKEYFEDLPIPLPPLKEQKQIVAVLDEAFEGLACARANTEANLQNARELFGSALHMAFKDESIAWNDTELADLGSVVTGSTPKTSDNGNLGGHLPFVKPGDFLPDGSLVYDNQGLSKKGASVSRVLPAGSALMVCIGATIGKAGYSDRPIATNQQINAVVTKDGISGEYLYYQMLTPEFQADVTRGSGQATLPIINKSKWSKLTVRVPSDPTKQTQIVAKLSSLRAQTDAASTQYKIQIIDLDDLRQSLLQKAFAGELT